MQQKKPIVAGIRIDGGKRVDLAEIRRRRKANATARAGAPSIEDTRVSDAWRRNEVRVAHEASTAPQQRRVARLKRADGGKDGTKVTKVKIRISGERMERHLYRSQPGTFEWRYGRNKQDALFHAGSYLARLWERAGMTVASSVDFLRGTRSGYGTGIADGRVAALDKLHGFREALGLVPSSQLIDYCVTGLTAKEIAHKNGMKERDMATVLHHHLRICAKHFDFM